jgi:hypothetical protein
VTLILIEHEQRISDYAVCFNAITVRALLQSRSIPEHRVGQQRTYKPILIKSPTLASGFVDLVCITRSYSHGAELQKLATCVFASRWIASCVASLPSHVRGPRTVIRVSRHRRAGVGVEAERVSVCCVTRGLAGWGLASRGRRRQLQLGMKTDRIRTDITDIVFVFIFMSEFGFEYG